MRNKKLIDSWNKIEPDSSAQDRMLEQVLTGSGRRIKIPYLKSLTAVAAACVVLLTGVYVYNNTNTHQNDIKTQDGISNQPDANPSAAADNPASEAVADLTDEIKGIPVKNFKLSEIEGLMEADRVAFLNLLDFFEYDTDSFVIVKVADTHQETATSSEISDKQISTVKVLETLWGDEVPEAIPITQYLYGGCTGDEATNLMRKDGVYLLPLAEYSGEYYLVGDLDVLFEVDDKGRIWSHSDYSDFSRFDGEDYQVVTDEVLRITQDDTLMLATSELGMALQGWQQLLEVTIQSDKAEETNEYGYTEAVYRARVEKILNGAEPETEVILRSNSNEDLPLNKGERYLLFVDSYDDMHYINANMMAGVNTDGTIKNLGNNRSPFAEYNGYTVEKMQELADQVAEYLKTIIQ